MKARHTSSRRTRVESGHDGLHRHRRRAEPFSVRVVPGGDGRAAGADSLDAGDDRPDTQSLFSQGWHARSTGKGRRLLVPRFSTVQEGAGLRVGHDELKLASGMTAPHRLKDLADVIEVIRILQLPSEFAAELDPYVREKYRDLWQTAQGAERE